MKHQEQALQCEERPITAQHVGTPYWVQTRSFHSLQADGYSESGTVMEPTPGCFRCLPIYND